MSTPSTVQHLRSGSVQIVSHGLDPVRCLHSLHRSAAADLATAETDADRRQATLLLDIARSGLDALGVTVASDTLAGRTAAKKVAAKTAGPLTIVWRDEGSRYTSAFRTGSTSHLTERQHQLLRRAAYGSGYEWSETRACWVADDEEAARDVAASLARHGFAVTHAGRWSDGPPAARELTVDTSWSQVPDDELDAALASTRARY